MYTIIITNDNRLICSVRERIVQRSKLVDKLHFLCDKTYNDFDMRDFTCTMEYLSPISKKYRTETLTASQELYEGMVEYTIPIDTNITEEQGDLELQLTFTKVELDPDGNGIQYVRKTTPIEIYISPVSDWSQIIPDEALTALDQRIIGLDRVAAELAEVQETLDTTKADNIAIGVDEETQEKYLTLKNKGEDIGDKIDFADIAETIADAAQEDGIELVTMNI